MKHKNKNEPVILTVLKQMFSSQTISYEKFENMLNKIDTILPDFKESIYMRTRALSEITGLNTIENASDFVRVLMYYYWSKSKEIYEFDKNFAEELMQTEVDSIPYQALQHLPHNSFAISVSDDEYLIVHKGYDSNHITSDYLVWLHAYVSKNETKALGLALDERFSKVEDLKRITDKPSHVESVIKDLNLILYLCAEKPDIDPNPEQKTVTRRTEKVRNVYREIRKWDVGYRFGSILRKQKPASSSSTNNATGSHSAKRPHIRRAHWHKFWTGPKDNQTMILKWLHPMIIHPDEDRPAVTHKT